MIAPGARPTWSRATPFGAWVRFGDGLLLAVDHARAAALGVALEMPENEASIASSTGPLEVHIAITSLCHAPCVGCYQDASPAGAHAPFDAIVQRIDEAKAAGASTVAFGGGEPLSAPHLADLGRIARDRGLVPVFTTSGAGLTPDRAKTLTAFAQVNVSHDGVGTYEDVRGYDGASGAERAIMILAEAGIPVGVNLVLTAASFDAIEGTAQRAADLGARELQLLRYKPVGRAASEGYEARRLRSDQIDALWETIGRIVKTSRIQVRIDCAMVPLVSDALLKIGADRVAQLGVWGCEAERHLRSRDATGAERPCSFLRGSKGETIRAWHEAPAAPCAGCPLFAVCRGGCQAVSLHAYGEMGPDPECPRVMASASRGAGRSRLPMIQGRASSHAADRE